MADFRTEIKVQRISISELLEYYYEPVRLAESCHGCPDYGSRWSCPPGTPDTRAFCAPYASALLIGVKVIYSDACRASATTPELAEQVRQRTYTPVKKALLETMLQLEDFCGGRATTIAAGRCEQCETCTRPEGRPCRKPERMRYSFSAFRFDLCRIAAEQLSMPLIWSADGLPEYNVAVAALLCR